MLTIKNIAFIYKYIKNYQALLKHKVIHIRVPRFADFVKCTQHTARHNCTDLLHKSRDKRAINQEAYRAEKSLKVTLQNTKQTVYIRHVSYSRAGLPFTFELETISVSLPDVYDHADLHFLTATVAAVVNFGGVQMPKCS